MPKPWRAEPRQNMPITDEQIDSTAPPVGGERGGAIVQSLEAEPTANQQTGTAAAANRIAEPETDESLSIDTILDVLSNQRRRYVIAYLSRAGPVVEVPELTDSLARYEAADPEEEVSAKERKRVYVALYQCHLPLLDKHNVVEFKKKESAVVAGGNLNVVFRCLTSFSEATDGGASSTSSARYFSLVLWTALTAGGISIFTSSLVVSGLPVSGVGIAVLSALITWAGVSLYFKIRSDGH